MKKTKLASKSANTEKIISLKALPDFFREFAEELETALVEGDLGPQDGLTGFSRIKIRVKKTGRQAAVKVKVKKDIHEGKRGRQARAVQGPKGRTPSASAKPNKPSYKQLKRRMGKTFESFSESLKSGSVPPLGDVEAFSHDVEQMASYADKGKPHCEAFGTAFAAFLNACRKADVFGAQAGYRRMEELKKVCHDRFK